MELKRSAHIVWYCQRDQLVMRNFALDRTVGSTPLVMEVLEGFASWRPLEGFLDAYAPDLRPAMRELVEALARDRWLLRRGEPPLEPEAAMDAWGGWNPSAGFFHAASRNAHIVGLPELMPRLAERAGITPMPPATKTYAGVPTIGLPRADADDHFSRTLRDRRTWRRFGTEPVPFESVCTLLQLSTGVQRWVTAEGEGRVPLKTSPSGGARHPIEIYAAVRNVHGVSPGLYHYAAATHALERLVDADPPPFDEFLPEQPWYRDAAMVIFLAAVYERTRWRYTGPRAYRAVMIEAGHVCQTFCLTATWLGLAPFCSMALAEPDIERCLGLDGVSESVLYAAGVGTRPAGDGAAAGKIPEELLGL